MAHVRVRNRRLLKLLIIRTSTLVYFPIKTRAVYLVLVFFVRIHLESTLGEPNTVTFERANFEYVTTD